jgi:Ca2+-transporting ATPase
VIFGNIRSFIRYLLSCNLSEILVVLVASLASAPLPILPLQILFLNLVTDVFPALALGFGAGSKEVMREMPRDPEEPVLTRAHWLGIAGYGVLLAAAVLGAFAIALGRLGASDDVAVTVSFLTLALAQLWHVFNMRAPGSRVLRNAVTTNPWVWGALALCVALLLAAVHLPPLNEVLGTRDPGREGWLVALSMSLTPLFAGQAIIAVRNGARR